MSSSSSNNNILNTLTGFINNSGSSKDNGQMKIDAFAKSGVKRSGDDDKSSDAFAALRPPENGFAHNPSEPEPACGSGDTNKDIAQVIKYGRSGSLNHLRYAYFWRELAGPNGEFIKDLWEIVNVAKINEKGETVNTPRLQCVLMPLKKGAGGGASNDNSKRVKVDEAASSSSSGGSGYTPFKGERDGIEIWSPIGRLGYFTHLNHRGNLDEPNVRYRPKTIHEAYQSFDLMTLAWRRKEGANQFNDNAEHFIEEFCEPRSCIAVKEISEQKYKEGLEENKRPNVKFVEEEVIEDEKPRKIYKRVEDYNGAVDKEWLDFLRWIRGFEKWYAQRVFENPNYCTAEKTAARDEVDKIKKLGAQPPKVFDVFCQNFMHSVISVDSRGTGAESVKFTAPLLRGATRKADQELLAKKPGEPGAYAPPSKELFEAFYSPVGNNKPKLYNRVPVLRSKTEDERHRDHKTKNRLVVFVDIPDKEARASKLTREIPQLVHFNDCVSARFQIGCYESINSLFSLKFRVQALWLLERAPVFNKEPEIDLSVPFVPRVITGIKPLQTQEQLREAEEVRAAEEAEARYKAEKEARESVADLATDCEYADEE